MLKALALLLLPFAASAGSAIYQSSISIESNGSLQYVVSKGNLKPQLLSLISEHPRFPEKKKIIWNTGEVNWPLDSAYNAETIDGLINDVASQVNLIVTYYPNGYVVVSAQEQK